jgi:collagen type III alpha
MQSELVDALAEEVVLTMKSALAPVSARLEALERRSFDALLERIAVLEHRLVTAEQRALVPGPAGERGLPGERGADGLIGPMGPAGERGADGQKGLDGAVGPVGERGADGTTGPAGPPGPPGPAGERGLDGRDGKDGKDGRDGKDGDPGPAGAIGATGEKGLDGAHGRDGIDGKDGTLEQLEAQFDGERTLTFTHANGTPVKGGIVKFAAVPLERGVYLAERAYEAGDVVTYGGSSWIAKAETQGHQPGTNDGGPFWRLMVKRGQDGKAGLPGPKGLDGKEGRPGRDLTQTDGVRKW